MYTNIISPRIDYASPPVARSYLFFKVVLKLINYLACLRLPSLCFALFVRSIPYAPITCAGKRVQFYNVPLCKQLVL